MTPQGPRHGSGASTLVDLDRAAAVTEAIGLERDRIVEDHEKRIRVVEQFQWKLIGAWGVLSFVVLIGCTVTAGIVVHQVEAIKQQLWYAPVTAGRKP